MSDASVTSKDIVTGIYQGNRACEALLVQTYSRSLLFVLEKRCGDRDLARDVCQETFLVLLEKFRRQQLNDPEKLAAYVQQTAINLLIAHKRKQAKRQTFPDSELIDAWMDEGAGPLDDVELMRIRRAVRDSILALKNGRDKEVLYRYYIQEQDKAEICSELQIDFRHFDKIISRARSRLRGVLSGMGEKDGETGGEKDGDKDGDKDGEADKETPSC